MHTRVIVIGGGLAGLIAAADLARRGLAPILLEASPQLGGRAQSQLLDGFCFNQGPHALFVGGALNATLTDFGVKVCGGRPDLTSGLALWGNDAHPWPIGTARAGLSPPLNDVESALLAAQIKRVFEGDYDGCGLSLHAATAKLPCKIRSILEALVRLSSYVHAPHLIDAKAAFDQLRMSFAGVIYVDGGWGGLVKRLAEAAQEAGAVLRTENRVNAVMREEQFWRVDIFGDGPITCDAIILALPPGEIIMVAQSSKALASMVSQLSPARVLGLDLGLSQGCGRSTFALGITEPTYMSVHSAVAKLAPDGGMLAHLTRYLGPDETPTIDAYNRLESLADDLLQGWRSHEVRRQRLVKLTVSHDIRRWRVSGRRAGERVADAKGLYLAGDWIGDRGMLADAAAASARVAANEALAYVAKVPARP